MPYGDQKPHHKASRVILAAILVVSASGFFMGLRQTSSHLGTQPHGIEAPESESSPASQAAPSAKPYAQMHELPKPNSAWSNVITTLVEPTNDLFAEVVNTDQLRAELEATRGERRAFDGAPPVVPHPIDQASSFACLSCHGEGKVVKGKIASKISHGTYGNCTQCHVPAGGPGLIGETVLTEKLAGNEFAGNNSPVKGARAFIGSPPTIPHPTLMRSDCMSCHRANGTAGIRTTHPYRQSCTQCHAPSAILDQRQMLTAELPSADLPPIGGLQ